MGFDRPQSLIIRADAHCAIGIGHFMRCLSLAEAWIQKGGRVEFLGRCESEVLRRYVVQRGISFLPLERSYPDEQDYRQLIDMAVRPGVKVSWVVVDGYHFDSDYQRYLKDAGLRLMCIDDYGSSGRYESDVVLNQNIHATPALYANVRLGARLLLGTRYVLLRSEFGHWANWNRDISENAARVLVTLGGGDCDNVTTKVLRGIRSLNRQLEVKIVVGPSNPYEAKIREVSSGMNCYVKILTDVGNMAELISWADVAVTAGGSTCWEMAFMGLPNIVVVFADNQKDIAASLQDAGVSIDLGWSSQTSEEDIAGALSSLLDSSDRRRAMSDAGRRLIDGQGAARVVDELLIPGETKR